MQLALQNPYSPTPFTWRPRTSGGGTSTSTAGRAVKSKPQALFSSMFAATCAGGAPEPALVRALPGPLRAAAVGPACVAEGEHAFLAGGGAGRGPAAAGRGSGRGSFTVHLCANCGDAPTVAETGVAAVVEKGAGRAHCGPSQAGPGREEGGQQGEQAGLQHPCLVLPSGLDPSSGSGSLPSVQQLFSSLRTVYSYCCPPQQEFPLLALPTWVITGQTGNHSCDSQ